MVRRRQRERSLFEVLLPDGHKLWPDWLRKIDTLLEDEAVIETVAQAMDARWPQSRRRGRLGTPAEVVLRMLILKHLFDWSYDDLEQEVRANLVYRAFTRIDAGEVPDAKTILKIAGTLGPDVIAQLHRHVVDVAKRAGVTHGRRFRIDTTVVETNVHYPTDSSLLQDGVRVLTRTMQRASAALGDPTSQVRNRLRSVGRRVLVIGRQARSPETRDALVRSYRRLMATTRAVVRDAETMVRRIAQRVRQASPRVATTLRQARGRLQAMQPLVTRILHQTRARLLGGEIHVPDKVLSVFEPPTEAIRKGKIAKRPNSASSSRSRVGAPDHHGVRGARSSTARHDPVDARVGPPHRHLQSSAGPCGRRPRLRVREERRRGDQPHCATGHFAQTRAEDTRAACSRAPTLVPAGTTLARRLRRTDQCHQATAWPPALSLSGCRWHCPLGWPRRHCQ